jgi:hypothetical protein
MMQQYLNGLMLLCSFYLLWIQFNLLQFQTQRFERLESQSEKLDQFNQRLQNKNQPIFQKALDSKNLLDEDLCWFAIRQKDQPLIYLKNIHQDQKFHAWLQTQDCIQEILEGDLFEFEQGCQYRLKRIAVLDQIALQIQVSINDLKRSDFEQIQIFKDQAQIIEKALPIHQIEDLEYLPKIGPSNLQKVIKPQFTVHPRRVCFQHDKPINPLSSKVK